MNRTLILLPGIFLACLITACDRPESHSAEFFVFGTLVNVHLPEAEPEEADRTFATLHQEFQRMHSEWHAWEPGELVRVNRALQSGESVETTDDIVSLIRHSQTLEELSGGHFNPAIGRLISLWGFHTSDYPIEGPPPFWENIMILVDSRASSLDITMEGGVLQSANRAVQLDFGGIAKGYAVDLAIELIRESGFDSAIVNAGGDMRAIGNNLGEPWSIGVQDPTGGVVGGIRVSSNQAVFTSGNYTRFRKDADERYAHILDPATGWPVEAIASATVIAGSGTLADAAATALMVAGPDHWREVAANMGVTAAMVIDEAGVIHATEEMLEYFSPVGEQDIRIE